MVGCVLGGAADGELRLAGGRVCERACACVEAHSQTILRYPHLSYDILRYPKISLYSNKSCACVEAHWRGVRARARALVWGDVSVGSGGGVGWWAVRVPTVRLNVGMRTWVLACRVWGGVVHGGRGGRASVSCVRAC